MNIHIAIISRYININIIKIIWYIYICEYIDITTVSRPSLKHLFDLRFDSYRLALPDEECAVGSALHAHHLAHILDRREHRLIEPPRLVDPREWRPSRACKNKLSAIYRGNGV